MTQPRNPRYLDAEHMRALAQSIDHDGEHIVEPVCDNRERCENCQSPAALKARLCRDCRRILGVGA
jgi:hypothetical protein